MNKGMRALKIVKELKSQKVKKTQGIYVHTLEELFGRQLNAIEKKLKQAEKNEKLLNVFKNALTIEHHEIAELDHSQDANDYFVRTLFSIKQNQIDNAIRKTLREWVLKNAFPKEIKALEIIRKNTEKSDFYYECAYEEKYEWLGIKLTQEEYLLLKEVLL